VEAKYERFKKKQQGQGGRVKNCDCTIPVIPEIGSNDASTQVAGEELMWCEMNVGRGLEGHQERVIYWGWHDATQVADLMCEMNVV
jgi:hypothetical protein